MKSLLSSITEDVAKGGFVTEEKLFLVPNTLILFILNVARVSSSMITLKRMERFCLNLLALIRHLQNSILTNKHLWDTLEWFSREISHHPYIGLTGL